MDTHALLSLWKTDENPHSKWEAGRDVNGWRENGIAGGAMSCPRPLAYHVRPDFETLDIRDCEGLS
jgi:hypothetical protein